MIIYSIVPMELIFQNHEQMEKQEIRELSFGEMTMLIEPTGAYEGKIIRLISPNPQDYLNPRYAPGQKIMFKPEWPS
ncbi:YlzJ-like family protein [Brevibacillus sp. H7]|uniref:YlzJ-like family protein n=1 Tax=Brevibacillus sp. H7 TaxID=3349138 RepID=UPI003802D70E